MPALHRFMSTMTLLDVKAAAAYCSCSPKTLRAAIRDGRLRAAGRIGRRFRLDPRDLAAFVSRAAGGL